MAGAAHDCVDVAAVVAVGCAMMTTAALDHIRHPSRSYSVRIRVCCSRADAAGRRSRRTAAADVGVGAGAAAAAPQRDSLNVHWQFQEVRRSSVKARCSGRQVLADEGDGAQRQRSGPGVYFGRRLKIARMQLQ